MPAPPEAAPTSTETCWRFGAFALCETQRRLERAGQAVRLGPRSFDLMLQLVRRAGEYIGKDELLATVWAGVVVEEASVRVHMSMLRKALGEPGADDECREWISNIPSRGYRFNGRVSREEIDTSVVPRARIAAPSFTALPARLTELVGRDADVATVIESLSTHRLVTIVGPGGIGKTSVAIRSAESLQQTRGTQVAFVDLSPLISSDHVLSTMARSLGAAPDLPDTIQAITQSLVGRDMLLVIDNCEHVVESLAQPVMALLTALPGLRVLATSRETLRVSGEWVLRLSPLAVPDAEGVSLTEALHWPAVRLLVGRAEAAGAGQFNESQGPLLARIARQLDGIPLAIELVAARLGGQSARDLAPRLDDHIRLFSISNRGAPPRHRTLAAALDWSIALLGEGELRLFRRLSVFRGRFDVDSALGVAIDVDPEDAFDTLVSLADKSLVFFDGDDAVAPYRLLDTTRSYAAALLAQSDERVALLRRHATLMLDLMKEANVELQVLNEQAWGERYAYRLNDVRSALEVCLVQQPDVALAAALVTTSSPLWFHLSQVAEFRELAEAALRLVGQQPAPDTGMAASLNTTLVTALLQTAGVDDTLDARCDQALAGAIATGSPGLELKARWGRSTCDMFRGEYAAALAHADALAAFVAPWDDTTALVLSHRVSAMANHFGGRFAVSRCHSEEALAITHGSGRTQPNVVGPDAVVATQALLVRTLWIQGEGEQALAMSREAVARAEALGHAVSLCSALYGACVVALWAGDIPLAARWIHRMKDEAQRRGLLGWLRYAEWFVEGLLLSAGPDREAHVRDVATRLSSYDPPRQEMLLTFCLDWLDERVVERLARGEGQWCAPETWRAVGWRHERCGRTDDAEAAYRNALDTARQLGAKAWEARALRSLADLLTNTGRPKLAAKFLKTLDGVALRR
ncbi:ATP-binding protein [Piscinibacter gummiphilus]|uniref:ATP-binding protein n=1 Tax=Piscinibacter gummiphilus TaxID=946333 RepID=UPI000A266FA4|nr:winged helix-turn-helix domain-containing protein [Piscinibacter gummiphilus]ATU68074.1 transcriptional regulator [Piscinibacter gummiphilus]